MNTSKQRKGEAIISACGRYRFLLIRRGLREGAPADIESRTGYVLWVMINPSTADALADDATIRRCIGFARGWGYDELRVVNLFAIRETKSNKVRAALDAVQDQGDYFDVVGHENDAFIEEESRSAAMVVCAWGAKPWAAGRAEIVVELMQGQRETLYCLGLSKDGYPLHPLMLPKNAQLQEYSRV